MRGGRRGFCHVSLAFNLKLLNYLQSFVGISIVLYSSWMLVYWNDHHPFPPYPAPAPAPSSSSAAPSDTSFRSRVLGFGYEDGLGSVVSSFELPASLVWLPAPWCLLIYSFMGVGIMLCSISFIGCIAAEALHGCCLCFYVVLVSLLLTAEASLVAFIALDRHWEQDLPSDPTGELDSLLSFIHSNADICKWIGIAVLAVQGLSLMVPTQNSVKGDGRSGHSDLWSSPHSGKVWVEWWQ
ncbi:hypothetical protein MLD38_026319 [Melastoma candidum]|uniref:Uncharacterized protein n=1 Tax=Melastoma candidum TaxID=119954 RepID=A0ACB9P1Q1_9MYRT|nr:hypothetical protein MLD38_026319 [Melastoma candidum]